MVYQWKTASHINADAQTAGQMCEELDKTVGLTPEHLLDANRSPDAPLHHCFEWNDTIAAEKYRIGQAGHIIRCLTIVAGTEQEDEQTRVRAFFKIGSETVYEPLVRILSDDEKHEQLLAAAMKELNAFVSKYNTLQELAPIRRFLERKDAIT